MIDLVINDKQYSVPEGFNELSLNDYLRIFNDLPEVDKDNDNEGELIAGVRKNEATAISRLLNEDDDFAINLPFNLYIRLSNLFAWIYNLDDIKRTNRIDVNGKEFKLVPPDKFSFKRWIDMDVSSNDKSYTELLSIILGEVKEDGEFKEYNGIDTRLAKELGEMKCDKALGIILRFFSRSESLSKTTRNYLRIKPKERLQAESGETL